MLSGHPLPCCARSCCLSRTTRYWLAALLLCMQVLGSAGEGQAGGIAEGAQRAALEEAR